jgi:hypothetical protein
MNTYPERGCYRPGVILSEAAFQAERRISQRTHAHLQNTGVIQ